MAKKKKIRIAFRKNRQKKPGRPNLSGLERDPQSEDDLPADERISGKGELTRHRTIVSHADQGVDQPPVRDVDEAECLRGRVLSPRGGNCVVQADDGNLYECAVRRVLKTIAGSERTAVVAGDRVMFKPAGTQGSIERVEPRHGTLSRQVRGQRHVIVANVDQVLIVASANDPPLKPSLIDRYLISAALGNITPVICINKADLVDPAELQPIVGLYSQLGYEVLLTSAATRMGMAPLRQVLEGKETALSGQSGVGKSSLINAVEPTLNLRTLDISTETRKGKHTTTNANLLKLSFGGWVVDTPGIRSMELWNVMPDNVEGYFVEFHPYVAQCRFPDCSHTHESSCGVKRAVSRGTISTIRYESYCRIRVNEEW